MRHFPLIARGALLAAVLAFSAQAAEPLTSGPGASTVSEAISQKSGSQETQAPAGGVGPATAGATTAGAALSAGEGVRWPDMAGMGEAAADGLFQVVVTTDQSYPLAFFMGDTAFMGNATQGPVVDGAADGGHFGAAYGTLDGGLVSSGAPGGAAEGGGQSVSVRVTAGAARAWRFLTGVRDADEDGAAPDQKKLSMPEPASVLILGVALFVFGMSRRRRRG